jgi:predicted amidohydrolase
LLSGPALDGRESRRDGHLHGQSALQARPDAARPFPHYQGVLSDLACRYRLVIAGASFWHGRAGRAVNTARSCRPDGTASCWYELHPTKPEQAIDTTGGDEVHLFDLNGIKVASLVCYDIQFPELSRTLSDGGAGFIVVPSPIDARGYWRVRHCAQGRAIESQIFMCVSPLIGNVGIPLVRSSERDGRHFVAWPSDNRFRVDDRILIEGLKIIVDAGYRVAVRIGPDFRMAGAAVGHTERPRRPASAAVAPGTAPVHQPAPADVPAASMRWN